MIFAGPALRGALLAFACALGVAACAHQAPATVAGTVVAVGGDVLQCAMEDAAQVEQAITGGGPNWLQLVISLFQCVPTVVKTIEAREALALVETPIAFMLADADGELAAPPAPPAKLKRGARRRLAASKVLGDLLNRSVRP